MTTELCKVHRPKVLDDLVGQPEAVRKIKAMQKAGRFPHTILLSGPSGCGKTTTARIFKSLLKCGKGDFLEINAADDRGIDLVRDIKRRVNLQPMNGDTRIWLIDECFPKGTQVSTPQGLKSIEKINVGSLVYNASGLGEVKRVFKNCVPLNRVVRLHFSNGETIVTTRNHEFLTTDGWVKAKDLEHGYEVHKDYRLRELQQEIPSPKRKGQQKHQILLSGVCLNVPDQAKSNPLLRGMWDGVCGPPKQYQGTLLSILRGQSQEQESRISQSYLHPRSPTENLGVQSTLQQNQEGEETCEEGFGKNASQQSEFRSFQYRKGEGHQTHQGDITYLERGTGRERNTNHPTKEALQGSSQANYIPLDLRTPYQNRDEARLLLRHCVQGGHSLLRTKDCYRGRWESASIEQSYLARCQEDQGAQKIRVVRTEIYERRSNDQSFVSVVSDQDRNRGFVEFFDLEVTGHPSYVAAGVLVHNCHQLTTNAQDAFLKELEDTPEWVYFILSTTDPHKLKNTVRTRATDIVVRPLNHKDMTTLLLKVLKKEKKQLEETVLDKLCDHAEGSARKALVILNSIIDLKDEEEQLETIQKSDVQHQAIEIARALLDTRTKWPVMAKLIKAVEEDAESLRWMVLGYMEAVMLGGGKMAARAMDIHNVFAEPFYNTKRTGLTACCWEVIHG